MGGEGFDHTGEVVGEHQPAAEPFVARAVDACNALTERWVRSIDHPAFVASGPSVWPLLAALAAGAEGAAREELEGAIGVPADEGLSEAASFLTALERIPGASSALGIWIRDSIVLDPQWLSGLPETVVGRLTGEPWVDKPTLDAWVRERTQGILDRMPVDLSDRTRLVLACALAVRIRWAKPFEDQPLKPSSGPWTARLLGGLHVMEWDVDRVEIAETAGGPLTSFRVRGTEGVDVQLVAGPEDARPSEILGEAIVTHRVAYPRRSGSALSEGETAPGLVVTAFDSATEYPPRAAVTTVRFDLTDQHDLLDHPDLVGLRTATDDGMGHFPGVSAEPLAVEEAGQVARATFTAKGFKAAAVTAIADFAVLSRPLPRDEPYRVRVIDVTFDRPFGFLAVDRMSRLVLFAGCVADPERWKDPLLEP